MSKNLLRLTSFVVFIAITTLPAWAQYPPGGGPSPSPGGSPSYSSKGKIIGITAGAVAAGAGLTYWALHNRPSLVGCVQREGDNIQIMSDKDGKLYRLQADSEVAVKPGERVALKGKKTDTAGAESFRATKVVKDYGACGANSASSSQPAAN